MSRILETKGIITDGTQQIEVKIRYNILENIGSIRAVGEDAATTLFEWFSIPKLLTITAVSSKHNKKVVINEVILFKIRPEPKMTIAQFWTDLEPQIVDDYEAREKVVFT